MLILGILFGITTILSIVYIATRLRSVNRYQRVVMAYIGDDAEFYYDEQILLDFYNHDMQASDCAREMVAANIKP